MRKPIDEICHKFNLSSEELPCPDDVFGKGKDNGKKMQFAHIAVMRHVTKDLLDAYLGVIRKLGKDAFKEKGDSVHAEPINKLHHMIHSENKMKSKAKLISKIPKSKEKITVENKK